MRGGGVLQRKHGIHYWLELLLAEEGQDLYQPLTLSSNKEIQETDHYSQAGVYLRLNNGLKTSCLFVVWLTTDS